MAFWLPLGSPPPKTLSDARLDCHYCAQIPSAVGVSLLEAAPDDSHSNLGWRRDLGVLVGRTVSVEKPFQAALRVRDLTVLLLDPDSMSVADFSLPGRTLASAYGWLNASVSSYLGRSTPKTIAPAALELPSHNLATGSVIAAPGAALEELARWYSNADTLIGELTADNPNASEVRCWPHHFDIASLISLDPGGDPETSRLIGIGMTPGDGSYDEPYFYVNPWPAPQGAELPTLAGGGHWHTEGWIGAALPAGDLIEGAADPKAQASRAKEFMASAIAASRKLLG